MMIETWVEEREMGEAQAQAKAFVYREAKKMLKEVKQP